MKKVDLRITIKASPEKVIEAFTNPQMLKEWWGVEKCLIQKWVGGLYTLAWNLSAHGMQYVSSGTITLYNPSKEIKINNFVYLNPEKPFLGPMSLYVKAQKVNDMTEVYLCQDGYQEGHEWDWYYEAVKTAWPEVMQEFKTYLENK